MKSWALTIAVVMTPALATAQTPSPRPGGFWKCLAKSPIKGEFNGEDPIGLAAHKHIQTDCTIHWSDGHGKTYCFASPPSLNYFDSNLELLQEAQAFWATSPRPAKP